MMTKWADEPNRLNGEAGDTIRDAILTCARKLTWVSLIYRTEPTTKKCKNRKTKSRKQIWSEIGLTVNCLGNPCSESRRRKRKGCGGKDLQKRTVLSLEWKWVGDGIPSILSMTVGREIPYKLCISRPISFIVVFLLLQFCTYGQLIVRAKTVSLSVRHIAYFTVHFCILCK